MLSRRVVVQAGLALPLASSLSVLSGALRAALAATDTLALDRFVFDARFAEASDVANAIEPLGVVRAPFAGDLMELWYDELDLALKNGPLALAGITTQEGLFVLETLALDHRMRVVYHGEHGVADDGRLAHTLKGPTAMLAALQGITEETHWAEALARALTRCPLGAPEVGAIELSSRVAGISLRDVPLHSWIIAPRAAVAVTI